MGYNIPHNRAKLLFRHKYRYLDGAIVEARVWIVPPGPAIPEGLKYSLVYVDRFGRRVLGYDNAERKGHHRHAGGNEEPAVFRGIWDLTFRFLAEVKAIREEA